MDFSYYKQVISNLKYIEKGDIVYIVSDIFNLVKDVRKAGGVFDIKEFLDLIMSKIGDEGTLMIPTFNWGFCKGKVFDYKNTKCQTGALGNFVLKDENYIRTKHPIYSFAVRGKYAEELYNMNPKDSFGKGSCFDFMYKYGAKALVIDLPALSGLTFLHYVEQMVGVPYRYMKDFTADYIDKNGSKTKRTYSMYVRDLEMDACEKTDSMNEMIEKLGICKIEKYNDISFRTVYLKELYQVIRMDILYNDCGNIYTYIGQQI